MRHGWRPDEANQRHKMTSDFKSTTMSVPSRRDNPFATCWTKPGAIPFRFDEGQSAASLVEKLASHNWRAAIVGPHGSGKSTLLESLKPALIAAGCRIQSTTMRDGERRLPSDFWCRSQDVVTEPNGDLHPTADAALAIGCCRILVVIDGFEQLAWLERSRLKWFCRRHNVGLLVTSHRPSGLPTLVHLSPNRQLINRLVADLCEQVSTGVSAAESCLPW
jgi:hypothetical protein